MNLICNFFFFFAHFTYVHSKTKLQSARLIYFFLFYQKKKKKKQTKTFKIKWRSFVFLIREVLRLLMCKIFVQQSDEKIFFLWNIFFLVVLLISGGSHWYYHLMYPSICTLGTYARLWQWWVHEDLSVRVHHGDGRHTREVTCYWFTTRLWGRTWYSHKGT